MQKEQSKSKKGIGIASPSRLVVPATWMAHMLPFKQKMPTGLLVHQIMAVGEVCEARTGLVEGLKDLNAEYILFIDTDTHVPYDCVNKWFMEMKKTDKKIITGFYYGKKEPSEPILYKEIGAGPWYDVEPQGYVKVGGAGLGCCMIDMEVFENMEKPWFKIEGTTEDHFFFNKAAVEGYDIWCDTDCLCPHYNVDEDRFYPGPVTFKTYMEKVNSK